MLCSSKRKWLYFSLDSIWEWNHFINWYPEFSFRIWHEKTDISLKCADNWESDSSRTDFSHLPIYDYSRIFPSGLSKAENKWRCLSFYDDVTHFILWKGRRVRSFMLLSHIYLLLTKFLPKSFSWQHEYKPPWGKNIPFAFLLCELKTDWKYRIHQILQIITIDLCPYRESTELFKKDPLSPPPWCVT